MPTAQGNWFGDWQKKGGVWNDARSIHPRDHCRAQVTREASAHETQVGSQPEWDLFTAQRMKAAQQVSDEELEAAREKWRRKKRNA